MEQGSGRRSPVHASEPGGPALTASRGARILTGILLRSAPAMRPRALLAVVLLALAPTGCASGGLDVEELTARTYAGSLGRAGYETIRKAVDSVLVAGRGYALVRAEEQYATLYYQTSWETRDPLPDESARGITAARTRIVVRARRVEGGIYGVTFEAENQIRTPENREWHAAPVTDDLVARMERVRRRLRDRIADGSDRGARPRDPAGARP